MKTDVIKYSRSFVVRFFGQFFIRCSFNKRAPQDANYLEYTSIETTTMFVGFKKTVSGYDTVSLHLDSVSQVVPKEFDIQILHIPFKKEFHLPRLFTKLYNIIRAEIVPFSNTYKGAFEFYRVLYDTLKSARAFLLQPISGKLHSLVIENSASTFYKIPTGYDLILKTIFLTDDEVRVDNVVFLQSGKIKVAPVQDIICIGFVHQDIVLLMSDVNAGIGVFDLIRNLRNNINKYVCHNPDFCNVEINPPKKTGIEVNCSRIKCIKLPVTYKLYFNSFVLCNFNEYSGKLFKYGVIPIRVYFGTIRLLYFLFAKSKIFSFFEMGRSYADGFSEAFTAEQFTVHHYKQLAPTGKVLDIFVSVILFDYPIIGFLRQEFSQLCKYILSAIHIALRLYPVQHMKSNLDVGFISVYYLDVNKL